MIQNFQCLWETSDEKDSGEKSDKEDDEILNNFITVLDAFKEKVVASYDKTLGKGVKYSAIQHW